MESATGQEHHQTHHGLQDALRQSEEETATLPHFALNAKLTHAEHGIGLLVLANDTLAIHQTKTKPLVLLDVGGILSHSANLARIINLGIVQRIDILCRHAMPRVLHRHFHIVRRLFGRKFHLPTLRRVFPGIVEQGIHHEEREGLVRLHHTLRIVHHQRHSLGIEGSSPFLQGVKQWLQSEILDIEGHHPLTNLHPMTQHIVIVVNFVYQFAQIAKAFTHLISREALVGLQLIHLMQSTVEEWSDAIDDGHRRQFLNIETLVLFQPLLKVVGLALQLAFLLSKADVQQTLLLHPIVEDQEHMEEFAVKSLHGLDAHLRPVLPLHLWKEFLDISICHFV